MNTAARRRALASLLADDVDAVLVTKLVNVRYLTGFTGSNGAVLVTRDGEGILATDGRYAEQAAAEAADLPTIVTRTLATDLVDRAAAQSVARLAIERHHVTLAGYDQMLSAAADRLRFADAANAVERLRVHKDDDEIANLQRACAITDAAFDAVVTQLRPGVTEREISWQLLQAMRAAGADGPSFDSIVAFGPHSAIPHHQPTDRPLAVGDLVKLDFGALVGGYHADMTRTLICGRAADWQRDLHATVRQVQEACRAAATPGAVPVELDALAQQLISQAGHDAVHGLGHGVGLEIHEQPFLTPTGDAARLDDRVPVTVEPGIYLPGRGGVRIEDTVLVTSGGARSLTTSSRDLLEI